MRHTIALQQARKKTQHGSHLVGVQRQLLLQVGGALAGRGLGGGQLLRVTRLELCRGRLCVGGPALGVGGAGGSGVCSRGRRGQLRLCGAALLERRMSVVLTILREWMQCRRLYKASCANECQHQQHHHPSATVWPVMPEQHQKWGSASRFSVKTWSHGTITVVGNNPQHLA